jgi:GDP/UDP-N,N'-diacetylbacillosamine 2-epimerase (hydrolysing)
MKRKICVVTGTRAEYGLLHPLLQKMKNDPQVVTQLVVTGTHLSTDFGLTVQEIERDGFNITRRIPILSDSDSPKDIADSFAKAISTLSISYKELSPDILVLLGDRYEMLAAAIAGTFHLIPIAHIHGGETTQGSMDEAFRHSMTKMSHFHFTSTLEHKKRVIQLGEEPSTVFQVGSLGVENLRTIELLPKEYIENTLNINFSKRNLLITFHSSTLEDNTASYQLRNLLNILRTLGDTTLIFTLPNADIGGRVIIEMLNEFLSTRENAYLFSSLGRQMYFSVLKVVDLIIGNSSSGLIEAPSLGIPTINIGDRQLGRMRATSVIDCAPNEFDIQRSIQLAYSKDFQDRLAHAINPYELSGTSERILEILKQSDLKNIHKKKFYDLRESRDWL